MMPDTPKSASPDSGLLNTPPMRGRILIIVLLSLFIGVVHLLPYLLFRAEMGAAYQHVYPMFSADEEHYAVLIKNALEGKFDLANNYVFAKSPRQISKPPRLESVNLIGLAGHLFHLDIEETVAAMRFLLPVVAFLLIFHLMKQIHLSDRLALVFASLNLLAPYVLFGEIEFIARPPLDFLISKGLASRWYEYLLNATLPYARLVNPQFSGLFFLAALICFVHFIKRPQRWLWLLPFALFAYFTFRFYFYFWSALGALLAIGAVLAFVKKQWRTAVPLFILLAIAALFAASSVLPLLTSSAPIGESYGFTLARIPILSPGVILALILLLLYPVIRNSLRAGGDALLYLAALFTILACMNQQLFTGRIVQPWHYELFVTPLLLSFALALMLARTGILEKLLIYLRQALTRLPTRTVSAIILIAAAQLLIAVSIFLYYFKLAPRLDGAVWLCALFAVSLWVLATAFVILLFQLLRNENAIHRALKTLFLGALLLICLDAIERQSFHAFRITPRFARLQVLAPAFHWLNSHSQPASAVFCQIELAEIVPLYTHNSVFIAKNAVHEKLSMPEAEDRLLAYFPIAGYSLEMASQLLREWPYRYIIWGLRTFGSTDDLYSFGRRKPVRDTELNSTLEQLLAKMSQPLETLFSRYNIRFVLITSAKQEQLPRDFSATTTLTKVFDLNGVQIHEVRSQSLAR